MSIKIWRLLCLLFIIWTSPTFATCEGLNCTCEISATGISFGTYNPLASMPISANGTVTVTCSSFLVGALISYTIALSAGNGSFAQRQMVNTTNPGQAIGYNIYTSSALTSVWGDGTAGTSEISDNYTTIVLNPVVRNYTAYGQITAEQNVFPGLYNDTIVATVTY